MADDDLGAERDLDPVDIALHHNLLVGVRRRRRVVHQPVAHQGRGRDLARHMLASLEGNRRQIAQGLEIGQQRRRLRDAALDIARAAVRAVRPIRPALRREPCLGRLVGRKHPEEPVQRQTLAI